MVTTTSAPSTASVVRGFGNSFDRSRPSSSIAATTAGLISFVGRAPGRPDLDAAGGVMVEERRGHLAPSRVVDADEQDLGDVVHGVNARRMNASRSADRR